MGDVSIRKRRFQKILKSLYTNSKQNVSKKLPLYLFFSLLLSVPARSGKRLPRGQSPQQLHKRQRDLQDPASRRAEICRKVRHIIAKIRHQKNTVLTQDSSETCTDRIVDPPKLNKTMALTPQPQETWTNSWTCWTSDLLEEKDQSLDWDLTAISTMTSNTSLRLDQKQSGQFNDQWMDLPLDDELKNMDKESLPFNMFEDMDMLANVESIPDEDFLNNFMDLSEFLLPEQPIEVTEEVQNVISIKPELHDQLLAVTELQEAVIIEEVVPHQETVKRKIDDTDMSPDWQANVDHDYVTKKPRFSPKLVVDSVKPSKSLTQKLTPDLKYREKRVKNNIASRRSREIRKMKYSDMEEEANRLVIENEKLKERIAEMEKLAKDMKALLVQKLAAK